MLSLFDHGPCPPCPQPFNMAAHVLGYADAMPDKVALAVLGLSETEYWTYDQLQSAVLGTGTGLLQAGLSPGDRVLMRLGNTVEFPIAYLGAIAVGLVPIPTSSQLTEAEVQSVIATVPPQAILLGESIACPASDIQVIGQPTLEAMRTLPAAQWHMGDPERPAYVLFTSGSSGNQRAVVHAHRAIWARRMMRKGWHDLRHDDRLLHAGAFNWSFTLGTGLMDPCSIGATALIPAPGIAPDQLGHLLQQHNATVFAAAPGVYRKILAQPLASLTHLRHGLSAGEKLSEPIRHRWENATATPIYEAFGMSECSTFISASPAHPAAKGTLGRPQEGRRIALLDDTGQPVPLGCEGTIAIHKSDSGLMLGYHGQPEVTARHFKGDWFVTGDQGHMDESGQITYHGRLDDMINAGGFRVSPLEVEAAMNTHPGITQCAVGEIEVKPDVHVIMAFYTGPAPVSAEDLTAHATARLARYKTPRGFFHVDALPTGANGKLIRRALAPVYEALNDQT